MNTTAPSSLRFNFVQTAQTGVAFLFILGLIVFQLPISPIERALSRPLASLQAVMFVNRQYRMYSPSPRAVKSLPIITLHYADGARRIITLHDDPLALGLAPMSREKWHNLLTGIVKEQVDRKRSERLEVGRERFSALARRLCLRPEVLQLHSVELSYKAVDFGQIGTPPKWDPEVVLQNVRCPGTQAAR